MWLAHHFPGLHLRPSDLYHGITPEETNAIKEAGDEVLDGVMKERWRHTEVIAKAARFH
jgi:hypothetical protein